MADYEVKIRITAQDATAQLGRATKAAGGLNDALGGILAQAAGMAAAFGGVQLLSSAFNMATQALKGLAAETVTYSSQLEKMNIGLASMVASVEGISFKEAQVEADGLYARIVKIAATSPLGPKEMFEVFSGLNSSMRNVGKSYDEILQTTQDASGAIGAMGIDIAQAARDFSLLAEGRAGMDVRTFTELNKRLAFGGKRVSTQEFNQMDAQKRIQMIQDALKRVGGEASKAFANSFEGLTSTFQGLRSEFQRVFLGPALNAFKSSLGDLNEFLLGGGTYEEITNGLKLAGEVFGGLLRPVFKLGVSMAKRLINAGLSLTKGVNQISEATKRFLEGVDGFMASGAAGTIAAGAGGMAVGGGIGAGIGGMLGGILGSVIPGLGTAMGASAGVLAGGAVGAGVGGLAGPVFASLQEGFEQILPLFSEMAQLLASSTWPAFLEIWKLLQPVLRFFGNVILMRILVGFQLLSVTLSFFGKVITDIASELGWVADWLSSGIEQDFQQMTEAARQAAQGLVGVANYLLRIYAIGRDFIKAAYALGTGDLFKAKELMAGILKGAVEAPQLTLDESWFSFDPATKSKMAAKDRATKQPPKLEVGEMNIKIQQDFRNQMDPDRLVRVMYDDLTNQAERNIASPFTNALAR